jgi:hypothetical protein
VCICVCRFLSPDPEKVLSKMENKYTLKIKTCGNGLAEDGYKWRKYGQKSIKNSPNPRYTRRNFPSLSITTYLLISKKRSAKQRKSSTHTHIKGECASWYVALLLFHSGQKFPRQAEHHPAGGSRLPCHLASCLNLH